MSGHTDGPWIYRDAPYGFDILVLDKPTERALWVGSVTTGIGDDPFYPPRSECRANAKLMSKAPDLFKSLVSVLRGDTGSRQAAMDLLSMIRDEVSGTFHEDQQS